jgi:hypothetical protein
MPTMFSNSRREHVDRDADAGTCAEFDDFIMLEYLHINISTMEEQIVASSVAESVHEDNIHTILVIFVSEIYVFHRVLYSILSLI